MADAPNSLWRCGLLRPRQNARRQTHAPKHWHEATHEQALSSFIPYSRLVSEHDVITHGGEWLRTWRLRGLPFEALDDSAVSMHHETWCNFLRALTGGQWAVWMHRVQRLVHDRLDMPVEAGFAQQLSQRHAGLLSQQTQLSHEVYLTLVYRPMALSSRHGRLGWPLAPLSPEQLREAHERAKAAMVERGAWLERLLHEFGPTPLGVRWQGPRAYSEVAEFLGLLINGGWRPIDAGVRCLSTCLPGIRLSVGRSQLQLRQGCHWRHAAMLDIQDYADAVGPGVLNPLLYLRGEFIECQSFSSLPRHVALRTMQLQRDQLLAGSDPALCQVSALDAAMESLADGQFCMGEYHYSLAILADTESEAADGAAQACSAISESSAMQLGPIDLIADAAWFAQWPANWRWRGRRAHVSSRAFAALACAHNFAQGKRDGNPWGQALAILRTPSGQPHYFSFHSSHRDQDNREEMLPGNTLIIGSTGVGKTTLQMFLLALSRKWQPAPRLVVFDLERSCEIALRALGGRYLRLQAGRPTGLNPFALAATPARMGHWMSLLRLCLSEQAHAQADLTAAQHQAVHQALAALCMLPASQRRLSTLRQHLPRDGVASLHARLARWCDGGELSWVFDGVNPRADVAALGPHAANTGQHEQAFGDGIGHLPAQGIIGFDTTDFLSMPSVHAAIMMELLHRMDEWIDGQRLIYSICEFWRALDHPVFADFAKHRQKTIRKHNGLGLFDTQSPSDLLGHPIGRTLIEQSATLIFLANPQANEQEYRQGFGLNRAEFELIEALSQGQSRRFLIKQGHASVVCELDLQEAWPMVQVLSANAQSVQLLDRLRAKLGDAPSDWLAAFWAESASMRTAAQGQA